MIEINNLKGHPLAGLAANKKSFSQVAKIVLKGENREREKISLAFVNKEEIKKLNKKFRNKNEPTDVLSFLFSEKDYLGEIIICPEVIEENARKYGVAENKEMMKVFVHGILHLCGYEHEKSKKEAEIMEKKQDFYLPD
jgi:probable rRNA maturation factor